MNKINKSFKLNKKGFSLIELIVVIALMVVATTIASMPLVNMYKARAKSAAEQVNTMLSQSKIDALSGVENEMYIYFDTTAKEYVAALKYTSGSHEGEIYKQVEFGNKSLTMKIDTDEWPDNSKAVVISFNRQTGALTSFQKGTYAVTDGKISASELSVYSGQTKTIKFTSNKTYQIDIAESTGLIELKYIG